MISVTFWRRYKMKRKNLVKLIFPVLFILIASGCKDTDTGGDEEAPTNASISLHYGWDTVDVQVITVDIGAKDNVGVVGYYISESGTTPTSSSSDWVSVTSAKDYSERIMFPLSQGNGTKTVYVWFKDAADNISESGSDSIILDIGIP